MKYTQYWFMVVLCAINTPLFAQQKPDDIIAVWDTGEKKVEIYKVAESYLGNPIDAEGERNTEIEVLNLKFTEGKWVGKIYSKRRGRLLDVACQLEGDKLLLAVTGRFVELDLVWARVK